MKLNEKVENKIIKIIKEEINLIGKKDNTTHNFELYKDICKRYPHVKTIIEGCGTNPRYAIYNIFDAGNRFIFYFHQSATVYFYDSKYKNDFIKYKVGLQIPGDTPYTFSISIHKK